MSTHRSADCRYGVWPSRWSPRLRRPICRRPDSVSKSRDIAVLLTGWSTETGDSFRSIATVSVARARRIRPSRAPFRVASLGRSERTTWPRPNVRTPPTRCHILCNGQPPGPCARAGHRRTTSRQSRHGRGRACRLREPCPRARSCKRSGRRQRSLSLRRTRRWTMTIGNNSAVATAPIPTFATLSRQAGDHAERRAATAVEFR